MFPGPIISIISIFAWCGIRIKMKNVHLALASHTLLSIFFFFLKKAFVSSYFTAHCFSWLALPPIGIQWFSLCDYCQQGNQPCLHMTLSTKMLESASLITSLFADRNLKIRGEDISSCKSIHPLLTTKPLHLLQVGWFPLFLKIFNRIKAQALIRST